MVGERGLFRVAQPAASRAESNPKSRLFLHIMLHVWGGRTEDQAWEKALTPGHGLVGCCRTGTRAQAPARWADRSLQPSPRGF